MSCLYSAQGQLQCTETFENCPDQTLNIGYDGRTNCDDVCTWYGYKKSCPMFAKYPDRNGKGAICTCSANYKNLGLEKNKFYFSSINDNRQHGYNIIGGKVQVFKRTSANDCFWKNSELKGNGYSTFEFTQDSYNSNVMNEKTPGLCKIYFNHS